MPTIIFDEDHAIAELVIASPVIGLANLIARAVADERERIATMVSGLDNTMMKQEKLAAHIRKRL